jgi:16S rRNA (guanine966-N2)-methyltransferase
LANPRIISGKARGIRLQSVPGDITRPITDRVKEALFNILGADIQDVSFLDLFGGTGSVGIEALSRGARFARFIDLNQPAISTIKTNLERTRLKVKAEVVHMDAFSYLKHPADCSFEYIYVAPPQYKGLWQQVLKILDDNPGWLTSDAWIIVQIDPKEFEKLSFVNFEEFEQRRYGSTLLVFYERTALSDQ